MNHAIPLTNPLLQQYELFPQGVRPITSPRFEEQADHVGQLLERLRGPFASHVQALGLEPIVSRLEEKYQLFEEKMSLENKPDLTFDQVAAGRAEFEEAYRDLIFVVCGEFIDDKQTLREVLAPVFDQQQRMASYLRRRGGNIPEVDPNTGEFLDEDVVVDPNEDV